MDTTGPHALYRFYAEGGELLYVGITNSPGRRWARHSGRPWWQEVRTITLETHPNRTAALAAEARAIEAERPRLNLPVVARTHKGGVRRGQRITNAAAYRAQRDALRGSVR